MKKKTPQLRVWRRLSQIFCFLLFLFLFIKTDYSGSDEIPYAVNIFFRLDPLLAICASLAARTVLTLMLPALVFILGTMFLGRFFCGWFCPLGALLDFMHRYIPPVHPGVEKDRQWKSIKYYLLLFMLAGSLLGISVAGYIDPFSILVRGMGLSVYPALNILADSFFTFTYLHAPQWVNSVTEPIYAILRSTLLPFQQNYFEMTVFSLLILLGVILIERIERRFFCRYICPLGGLYGVVARFSFLHPVGGSHECGKCRNCINICRMGAIDEDRVISQQDCNLCMDCVDLCPKKKISFQFNKPIRQQSSLGITRRGFLTATSAGLVLPFILHTRTMANNGDPHLIRPPGALIEDEFLARCVRCGECMKVCIGNGLQPTFLQAGVEGMFSPILKARTGYCEYNCTLCGQVCPTGAISKLNLAGKHAYKMGNVFFDKNRCLPYAKGIPCIVCEEHCPTSEKAIQFREVSVLNDKGEEILVKQPYVVDERCVGCGICETKCPLPGASAVRVTSAGESRNPENEIPGRSPSIY